MEIDENPIRIINAAIEKLRSSLHEYARAEIEYRKEVANQNYDQAKYCYFKYLHESGLYESLLNCSDAMIKKCIETFGADPDMAASIVGIDVDVEIFNAFHEEWKASAGTSNHQTHI